MKILTFLFLTQLLTTNSNDQKHEKQYTKHNLACQQYRDTIGAYDYYTQYPTDYSQLTFAGHVLTAQQRASNKKVMTNIKNFQLADCGDDATIPEIEKGLIEKTDEQIRKYEKEEKLRRKPLSPMILNYKINKM